VSGAADDVKPDNHSFTREGGWEPHEVTRDVALNVLPCVVNIGSHNFVCRTVEDEQAVVDRCNIDHLRWFINGASLLGCLTCGSVWYPSNGSLCECAKGFETWRTP
jgi:hypothetical protein